MSQEVGALRVSLTIDTAEFTKRVSDINARLKAVRSEFNATGLTNRTFGNSLEGLKSKYNNLTRVLELQRQKVQTLRQRYQEVAAAEGENSRAATELSAQYNNAVGEMTRMESQLSEIDRRIRTQSSSWYQLGQRLQAVGDKMKAVGDKMKDVGKSLSMKLTAPIAALGTLTVKSASDFESAFAGVRKTVDASESEFKAMEKSIRDMAKSIPASTTEIAGVAEAAGQLGIKKENIMGFTRTMIDLGVATNMTSEQAATDLARLANITQMSQKDFDRLGSSIVALGNNFATTESEIVSMALRLAGQGHQIGMTEAQINALATAMSSVGIEAEAGGTAMSTIMKKIDVAVGVGGKHLDGFVKVAGVSAKEFTDKWKSDPVMALDLFIKGLNRTSKEGGNLAETLGFLGIKGIREQDTLLRLAGASNILSNAVEISTKGWKENKALTNEAQQRYKTFASQMQILKNKLNDLGITLGNIIIPVILSLVKKVEPLIQKFSEMSKSTQKVILVIAGIVAAIGPVLVIFGTLFSSIGSIASAFGAVSGAIAVVTAGATAATPGIAALASVFTALTGPIGIAVMAVSALGVGIYALVKHFKKPSMEVKIFGDEVSKGTQKAVGGFLKLNDQASKSLSQLSITGQTVTGQMVSNITGKFNQMGDQIIAGLNKRNEQQITTLQNFFSRSSALTDKEEQAIIAKNKQYATQKADEIKKGEDRIAQILNTAKQQKRGITDSERQEINKIQQQMVETGIKTLSKNELESKSIMERMKANAGKISAQQAADVVKNSKKQTDEAIKNANSQYDKTVQAIIKQRDETHTITADQAKKLIAEAKKQRDETVKKAEDMQKKVVSAAKKQAGDHAAQVDWEKGEVLSKWEMLKKDTKKKVSEMADSISKKWSDIKKDTSQKWDEIKAWPGKKLEEMKKTVGEKMEGVKKKVSEGWEKAEKVLSDIDLKQIGKDIIQGLINGIGSMASSVAKKAREIANSVTKTIKSALGIHSPSRVTTKLGEDTGQGFANGIAKKSKASEKAAKAHAAAVKKAFTEAMDKAEYKFKMGQINSAQYIAELRKIRSEYAKTPDQVRKVNLEIKKIQDKSAKEIKALQDKQFKEALKSIKDKAAANKISTAQELTQLQNLAKKYKKNSDERLQIEKEIAKVKKQLAKEEADQLNNAIKKIKDKAAAGKISTETELKQLQDLASKYKKNSDERIKVEKEIAKVKKQLAKEEEDRLKKQFDKEKDFIENKKNLNQLSLTDELKLYEKYMAEYKKGSEQRKYWEQQVYDVKKRINDQLLALNDEYTTKIQEANQKLIDGEKALNEEYQKALADRTQSLVSFAGIFDEVSQKSDVTGQQLLDNLQGQVTTFASWMVNISVLAERGVLDAGLLDELRAMGPKAAAEVAALNTLTDEQLAQYSGLWKAKNELARQQATSELEGMKTDTQKKIEELRAETANQLEVYKNEWAAKVKEISTGTKKQFNAMTSSMNGIGKNTIQGLMDGMAQMTGPLMAQAKSIADSISSTIKKALEIKSPSRVMLKLGQFTGQGLALGMANSIGSISQQANAMARAAIPSLSQNSTAFTKGNTIDNSKHFQPYIVIQTTESPERVVRRELDRLAFKF